MPRIDQINELIRSELANLISREIFLKDGLITVSYVDCSPDLNNAKIGISVLPDNFCGTALKKLRSQSGQFANTLKKKLKIKKIPRFTWLIDTTEVKAAAIDDLFVEINKNK